MNLDIIPVKWTDEGVAMLSKSWVLGIGLRKLTKSSLHLSLRRILDSSTPASL